MALPWTRALLRGEREGLHVVHSESSEAAGLGVNKSYFASYLAWQVKVGAMRPRELSLAAGEEERAKG